MSNSTAITDEIATSIQSGKPALGTVPRTAHRKLSTTPTTGFSAYMPLPVNRHLAGRITDRRNEEQQLGKHRQHITYVSVEHIEGRKPQANA